MILPEVSIIMPAYNSGRFISESIESVMAQTEQDWELIIVDDGSTDNTKQICWVYMQEDARIRYLYQENGRQGKARNKGIRASRGHRIAFLDADDIWEKDFLEKQLNLLYTTVADLVYANIAFINEQSEGLQEKHTVDPSPISGREGIMQLLKSNPVPLSTVVVEKDSLLKAGSFQESSTLQYGEDFRLWLDMLACGFILQGNPETLVRYRKHPAQSSQVWAIKYLQQIEHIRHIPAYLELEAAKKKAIALWLFRKWQRTKDISKTELQQDIHYMPTGLIRNMASLVCRVFPSAYARKMLCFLTKKQADN